jgi:hypothetical protein
VDKNPPQAEPRKYTNTANQVKSFTHKPQFWFAEITSLRAKQSSEAIIAFLRLDSFPPFRRRSAFGGKAGGEVRNNRFTFFFTRARLKNTRF